MNEFRGRHGEVVRWWLWLSGWLWKVSVIGCWTSLLGWMVESDGSSVGSNAVWILCDFEFDLEWDGRGGYNGRRGNWMSRCDVLVRLRSVDDWVTQWVTSKWPDLGDQPKSGEKYVTYLMVNPNQESLVYPTNTLLIGNQNQDDFGKINRIRFMSHSTR